MTPPRGWRWAGLAGVLAAGLTTGAAAVAAPDDPGFAQQWGLRQIGAPEAWGKSRGVGVVLAVVDTGVDPTHPDLASQLLPAYNASRRSTENTGDDNGHGTHVAGIAAAATGNRVGIAGVAPDARILPIKVLDDNNVADAATEITVAVRYALAQGAKVINLSVSSLYPDLPVSDLEAPCNDAFVNGALCVLAAGNRGAERASGFSRDLNAVVVTANDGNGSHAPFAQRADTKWAVSAPGVGIYSTVPVDKGSYASKNGTSMAAPHVAGTAALLFAQGLDNRQVVERLLVTARFGGDRAVAGAGLLDAAAAVGAPRAAAPGPPAPGGTGAQASAEAPAPSAPREPAPRRSSAPAPTPGARGSDGAVTAGDPANAASAEPGSPAGDPAGREAAEGLAAAYPPDPEAMGDGEGRPWAPPLMAGVTVIGLVVAASVTSRGRRGRRSAATTGRRT